MSRSASQSIATAPIIPEKGVLISVACQLAITSTPTMRNDIQEVRFYLESLLQLRVLEVQLLLDLSFEGNFTYQDDKLVVLHVSIAAIVLARSLSKQGVTWFSLFPALLHVPQPALKLTCSRLFEDLIGCHLL
jgi:hypothetical protein